MKKTIIYGLGAVALAFASYFLFFNSEINEESNKLFTEVKQGPFEITVKATGELKAKNSIKIRGPQGMRSVGIFQTTIKDLVAEGTTVTKGSFVASLDKTELATKVTEIQTEIEKELTRLEQTKIDTAIQMKGVRDEMANLIFSMEQEKLEIEKNKYEPQMVIDQSKLKLENSERQLDQLENKIELLRVQSMAKVREIETNIKQQENKLKQLNDIGAQFTIMAPEDGMVIYENSWNGKKGPGSQVSAWDPVVAELPDLSQMNSIAYVNEVDISKISKGQMVNIIVDAFPEKSFTGLITSVANIGQQLRNQEAKVFEIIIEIQEQDDILRPAMTTSNNIKIFDYEDVKYIPLEAFLSDSIDYVIKKVGGDLVRQEVVRGPTNADNIIIIEGVEVGDELCISSVSDIETLKFIPLSEAVKAEAKKKILAWEEMKATYDKENADKVKNVQKQNKDFSNSGGFIIMG